MKILFISTYCDPASGAVALVRLQKKINQLGHKTQILTIDNPLFGFENKNNIKTPNPFLFKILSKSKIFHKLISKIINKTFPFLFDIYGFNKLLLKEIDKFDPDIINIHWTHGPNYIPLSLVPKISSFKPVFWTIHDMWPITGTCTFTLFDCGKWQTGCGKCLEKGRLMSFLGLDFSGINWNIKNKIFKNSKIITISPSKWLKGGIEESIFFRKAKNYWIPNGIDFLKTKPIDKKLAKKSLGIPVKNKVILSLATPVNSPRKGVTFFVDSINLLWKQYPQIRNKTAVLIAGKRSTELKSLIKFKTIALDKITNEEKMRTVYLASDVYVVPSLADNLPSSIMESMVCQTPIIAFDSGGIRELVRKNTGLLVKKRDSAGLAKSIYRLLMNNVWREKLGRNCRTVVKKEYSLNLQAKRYLNLFKKYLNEKRN